MKKGNLMVFRFVVLQMRMRSPLFWAIDAFLPEASSRSLLHVCEQQRFWRDCADAQARLSLCWSPMWQVPFSHVLLNYNLLTKYKIVKIHVNFFSITPQKAVYH